MQQPDENPTAAPEKAVVRRLPVLSDALARPVGGLQGLAWFLGSLVCDEWGQPATEILQASSAGLLQQMPGRAIKPEKVNMDCAHGIVTVRLASQGASGQGAPQAAQPSSKPSKAKNKVKGKGKGKVRDKKR